MFLINQICIGRYIYFFHVPIIPELYLGAKDCFMLGRVLEKGLLPPDQDPTEHIEAYKYYFSQPGICPA